MAVAQGSLSDWKGNIQSLIDLEDNESRRESINGKPDIGEKSGKLDAILPQAAAPGKIHVEIAIYGGVGVCAFAGFLARYSLKELFTVGAGLHGDVVANMLGAFIFGVLSSNESLVKPRHPSFYTGLTTGFAGSCTTFSTWMVECAVMLWSPDAAGDRFGRIFGSVLMLITGLYCLIGSLKVGQWVGKATSDAVSVQRESRGIEADEVEQVPLYSRRKGIVQWVTIAGVFLAVLISTGIVVHGGGEKLAWPESEWEAVLFVGLLFAPLGAWLRFVLSKHNPKYPTFPVYTFLANILGTLVSITCWIVSKEIRRQRVTDPSHLLVDGSIWVSAIGTSFCGCLSTASTFANELDKLSGDKSVKSSRNALVYAATSIGVAQLLLCGIINAYFIISA